MPELKAGDSFPEDVTFTYIPFTSEKASIGACGIPVKYDASKEWKNKKVVLIAVPGAFTPTCSERHVPGFLDNKDKLKAKGVDHVVVIAVNDSFVMSAWGKANQVTDDFTLFMADDNLNFSKSIGWVTPDGSRSARYAIVIDHGKVVYAEQDVPKTLDKSSAEAVLAKL